MEKRYSEYFIHELVQMLMDEGLTPSEIEAYVAAMGYSIKLQAVSKPKTIMVELITQPFRSNSIGKFEMNVN